MAKAIIYVFSGTKNTLIIAEMIRNSLLDKGVSTTVQEIRKPFSNISCPEEYDFVDFGYPLHAFNAPQVFLEYVKILLEVSHCKAFIFKHRENRSRSTKHHLLSYISHYRNEAQYSVEESYRYRRITSKSTNIRAFIWLFFNN